MKRVILSVVVVFALLAVLAGCGGGKKSSSSSTSVSIAISPTAATVNTGATQQFTVTVSNTTNTNVIWTVNGVASGNQTVGFISSSGLYTAPNSVPVPATVTITATSQADTTQAASAQVTISAPSTPTSTLVVSPPSVTLAAGGQQTFTATSGGSAVAVNWAVNCQSTATGACGTITSSGVFTAPLSPPPGANVTVTATPQSGNVAASGAVVMVQFGNASLTGQYAFSLSGQNAGVSYLAAGSISFDGKGGITGGTEDINNNGVSAAAITGGTYNIGSDGRGVASVTTTSGTTNWRVALVNASHGYLIRFDSGVPGASGTLDLQDATQIALGAGGFSGAYAFNLSGANSSGKPGTAAAAGALTSNGGGAITSGVQDVNNTGVASMATFTGTYTAPVASGRGTAALSNGQTFSYYIVDATHVKVVETDASTQLAGDLFKQAAGPFSNATFKGGIAFAALGSRSGAVLGEGGVLSLDASGNVTAGTIDLNANGTPQSSSVTGTYSLVDAVTGRATLSISVAGATLQYALYPQSNGALSLVEIDSSANVVAGRALPQTGPFASGTVAGNYALNFTGTDFTTNPGQEDIVGQVVPNGGSALAGAVGINDAGNLASSATLSGSYSVSTNGRGSTTLTTGSNLFATGSLNFYIADSGSVFFLESDGNRVLVGMMQKQF